MDFAGDLLHGWRESSPVWNEQATTTASIFAAPGATRDQPLLDMDRERRAALHSDGVIPSIVQPHQEATAQAAAAMLLFLFSSPHIARKPGEMPEVVDISQVIQELLERGCGTSCPRAPDTPVLRTCGSVDPRRLASLRKTMMAANTTVIMHGVPGYTHVRQMVDRGGAQFCYPVALGFGLNKASQQGEQEPERVQVPTGL